MLSSWNTRDSPNIMFERYNCDGEYVDTSVRADFSQIDKKFGYRKADDGPCQVVRYSSPNVLTLCSQRFFSEKRANRIADALNKLFS
jgi:hypothetical protein